MARIIVFGEDWGAHPSSTQYLINDLRRGHDIVWVNSIGLRRPRLSSTDLKRMFGKGSRIVKRFASRDNHSEAPFPVIDAAAIPWPGNPIVRKINGSLIRKSLQPYLDGDERPYLWLSLPSAVDVVGKLDEGAVIYYCGDDFSSLAGVDHAAVSDMEEELAGKADLIIVVSEVLAGKFPEEKTHIVHHGVDFELFSGLQSRPEDLPAGKPVAGFYGSIAEWIDQELICECASRLPDWNFVIIGPARVDFTSLTGHQNIYLLGPRPHGRLPGYVQHWNVALLPFKRTEQIRACNPLKLREYLASGTPVVSTYFPSLERYRNLITVADSRAEFIQAIEESRKTEGKNIAGQRRVASETWSSRAEEVERLLRSLQ